VVDQEQEFSIVGGEAPGYNGSPQVPASSMTDEKVTIAVNSALPSMRWHDDNDAITLENGTSVPGKFFDAGDGVKIKYHDCGIYMADLNIEVTQIEGSQYKAYVDGTNTATRVHMSGIGNTPETGAAGPEFNMNFTTPTINGDKNDSILKIKVQAPPAGYELTNLFWVWEEDVYKYKEKEIPVLDASGTPVLNADGSPKVIVKKFYDTLATGKKCSTGLKLVVYKPADSQGFSAYRVYDTHGPVSSNLTLTNTTFSATGVTTSNFELLITDSNPFTEKEFDEVVKTKDLSQNKNKLGIEVFYSYPTYHYEIVDAPSFASLANHGLANLADAAGTSPSFKTYKHTTKWYWKKAETTVSSIAKVSDIEKDGKLAGSVSKISGQITIQNPKPWHQYSAGAPKFAIFAMAKDSGGRPCKLYDGIVPALTAGVNTPNDNAELTEAAEYAFNPADKSPIPVTDGPQNLAEVKAAATWPKNSEWQELNYLSAADDIGPEIQVFVCDTRTNRYHVFGTKKNVAFAMANSANKALHDYATLNNTNTPYLGKNGDISTAHQFTTLTPTNDLFNKFLQGPDAVSTVSDDTNVGIVCQKNTRLLFYARAFDNDGYMDGDGGITSFAMTLTDKHETKSLNTMLEPLEHVFRYENADTAGTITGPYVLTVDATDKNGQTRQLILNIGILGRILEIRTLEERRDRID